MSTPRLARCFLAVDPDTAGRGALLDLQHALQQQGVAAAQGWTARQDLHLTLQFLGDLEAAEAQAALEAVTAAARAQAPFTLRFSHVEGWPALRPRLAVAVFAPDPALDALRAALSGWAQGIGLLADPRPFVPHVTLLRSARPLPALPSATTSPFALHCGDLALMHRAPAGAVRYARFGRFRIGG